MAKFEQIEKEQQIIARCEKSLALEKLKKRRSDTRRKIELGGLVIKSGISIYEKSIILGGLIYISIFIKNDPDLVSSFKTLGDNAFS